MSRLPASVLLLPGVPSDNGPSMARYARELFSSLIELAESGYAFTLEQPAQRNYLSRVIDHPQARRIDNAWCRYVTYPRSLRKRRADVFHILDHGYAHLARSAGGRPVVVTCHDLIPLLAAERVIPMEISATVAFTFRRRLAYLTRASKVIVNSCATKATLERHTRVRGDQIVVVPYGLSGAFRSIPESRSVRRAAAGVPEHSSVLLQVATGARYKNTKAILHALAMLRTRIHDLRLVRIGAPLFADESELARKLDVHDSITHLGVIHDDRMLAEWYNAADALVFPSLWEGFGWPPLEAMGCGTPVVASNVAAIAEVVGDAGLLVPPDDHTALADATERVLTDPALAASLTRMGFERARRYTWASAARRTAAVYGEVLGSRP